MREPGHSFPRYGYQQMVGALSVWLNKDPAHKCIAAVNQLT